jgi:outer membrane protein assembly factor BamB
MDCPTLRGNWILAAALAAWTWTAVEARGQDWPQFRGPERNGVSQETGLADRWPKEGPPVLWQAQVGVGGGSCSIVGDKVYVMGALLDEGQRGRRGPRRDSLLCLQVSDGKELWRTAIDEPTKQRTYHSPHVTPTVVEGKVYTASRTGRLACIDAKSGKVLWNVDTRKWVGGADHSFYGYSCSPLVLDGRVYVYSRYGTEEFSQEELAKLLSAEEREELSRLEPEKRDRFFWRIRTSILAYDARTGRRVWRSRPVIGSTRNDMASPVVGTFGGKRAIVWPTGTQLVAVDPSDGKVLWQFDYVRQFGMESLGPSHCEVTPVIVGDLVIDNIWNHRETNRTFCVRVGDKGPRLLWQSPLLVSWYHSYVPWQGMLLGVDNQGIHKGQGPALPATRPADIGILQSYDLKSGELLWHTNRIDPKMSEKRIHVSRPGYIVADGKLILQNHEGLSMLKIDRKGSELVGYAPDLGKGTAYSLPALSRGRLYVRRTNGPLYCLDLRPR